MTTEDKPYVTRRIVRWSTGAVRLLLSSLANKNATYIYGGCSPDGNLGDALMLPALRAAVPQCRFFVHSVDNKPAWLNKFASRLVGGYCLGGGTLIGGLDALQLTRWALSSGLRCFSLGTGVRDPQFWRLHPRSNPRLHEWVALLEEFKLVSARGVLSRETLRRYGLQRPIEVTGDLACLLTEERPREAPRQGVVGINYGHSGGCIWGGDENASFAQISEFVRLLLRNGFNVRFFPVWAEDLPVMRRLAHKAGCSRPWFLENYLSWDAYKAAVATCDVFVGMKLHSVVLASCVGVPSLMLEYRPKCADFMATLGFPEHVVRTDRLDPIELVDTLETILTRETEVSAATHRRMWQLRRKTEHFLKRLVTTSLD